jgi:hypothetical protein
VIRAEYKDFQILTSDAPGLYRVTTIGRGSVPQELKGRFTSVGDAKSFIDRVKEKKNGKNKGNTGL